MDQTVREAIYRSVEKESFARKLNMKLVELEDRYSAVEMTYDPQTMGNIYDRAHGGVIFSLIDEAFETVGQADGTVGVAMNVSVTYVSSPEKETVLRAEAKEISSTLPSRIMTSLTALSPALGKSKYHPACTVSSAVTEPGSSL